MLIVQRADHTTGDNATPSLQEGMLPVSHSKDSVVPYQTLRVLDTLKDDTYPSASSSVCGSPLQQSQEDASYGADVDQMPATLEATLVPRDLDRVDNEAWASFAGSRVDVDKGLFDIDSDDDEWFNPKGGSNVPTGIKITHPAGPSKPPSSQSNVRK